MRMGGCPAHSAGHPMQADSLLRSSAMHIPRTALRRGSTIFGVTESSSIPMAKNRPVSSRSAASSPQMPTHFPYLWAFSATCWIRRRTAGWCGS